jgi:hypothetical protein
VVAPNLADSLPEIYDLCLVTLGKKRAQMSIVADFIRNRIWNNELCISSQVFKVYHTVLALLKLILERINIRFLVALKASWCEYEFKWKFIEVLRRHGLTFPENRLPKI